MYTSEKQERTDRVLNRLIKVGLLVLIVYGIHLENKADKMISKANEDYDEILKPAMVQGAASVVRGSEALDNATDLVNNVTGTLAPSVKNATENVEAVLNATSAYKDSPLLQGLQILQSVEGVNGGEPTFYDLLGAYWKLTSANRSNISEKADSSELRGPIEALANSTKP